MGEPPIALGIVLLQYLDHMGIRGRVQTDGSDEAQRDEAGDQSVEIMNGDPVLAEI